MACCEKRLENQEYDFNGEKLDIIISGSGEDGHCRSQTLKDTSNTNLKFELTRIAPLVSHHRKEIGHVMETFSMTDLRIQYLFMENNVNATALLSTTQSFFELIVFFPDLLLLHHYVYWLSRHDGLRSAIHPSIGNDSAAQLRRLYRYIW